MRKTLKAYLVSEGSEIDSDPKFIVLAENLKSAYALAEKHLRKTPFYFKHFVLYKQKPYIVFQVRSEIGYTNYTYFITPIKLIR